MNKINVKSYEHLFILVIILALWAIVPLMIIKGRTNESPKMKTSPEVKSKKKVGLDNNLLL